MFGVLVTILLQLKLVVHSLFEESVLYDGVFSSKLMVGIRELIGTAALAHGLAFFLAFFIMMILLMNRIVFRSERGADRCSILPHTFYCDHDRRKHRDRDSCRPDYERNCAVSAGAIWNACVAHFFYMSHATGFLSVDLRHEQVVFRRWLRSPVADCLLAGLGCYLATAGRSTGLRRPHE